MAEASRVLVVDDEPGITDLLSMAYRYEGLRVEVAHTGREALRRVATFRPHLMVLEVMLPGLDGFEVIRRLSADARHLPVSGLAGGGTFRSLPPARGVARVSPVGWATWVAEADRSAAESLIRAPGGPHSGPPGTPTTGSCHWVGNLRPGGDVADR